MRMSWLASSFKRACGRHDEATRIDNGMTRENSPNDNATPVDAACASTAALSDCHWVDEWFDEVASRLPWLGTPVRRSSFWTIFCYAATQVQRLVTNVLVARLLFPEAFGLMTIVNVFVQGLQMFSDIGIGPSIIQHGRGDEARFLNTAWTIQVLRGFALAACSMLLAWPLARYYGEPQILPLVCAAGLTAAISGFNSTYLFTVRRSMKLAGVTLLEIGAQVAGSVMTCVWALIDRNVWALMAGAIVCSSVRMAASHVLNRRMPNRLAWDRQAYGDLLHFGRWIFISTIITFCAMQGDRILLSNLIPMETLGVYTLALTVALLPNVLLSTLAFSVLYPLLCQAGRVNRAELEAQLLRARGTLLTFGVLLVLAVGAGVHPFFRVLYDSRYQAAIWMGQLMCVTVWMMVLNTTLETSLLALGDSRGNAGCGFFKFLAVAAMALAGFRLFGTPGFILGMGAGTAVGQAGLLWALARHGIQVGWQDLQYTTLIAVAGVAAAGAGYVVPFGELVVVLLIEAIVAVRLLRSGRGRSLFTRKAPPAGSASGSAEPAAAATSEAAVEPRSYAAAELALESELSLGE